MGSGAASVTPPTLSHLGRQQTGSAAGQLITARANQRNLSQLKERRWFSGLGRSHTRLSRSVVHLAHLVSRGDEQRPL